MKNLLKFTLVAVGLAATALPNHSATIDPFYAGSYTLTDLGSIAGVPANYGGLTLLAGDNNSLLIGGNANTASGKLYQVPVTRDGNGHITGFAGPATVYADAAYNDGGVVYGPVGVLFAALWPVNKLGQTLPGSSTTDKIVDLAPFGVANSAASLAFVPAGMPGAGQMKLVSWSGGEFYTLNLAPDGSGTYNVTSATLETTLGGGPEGIAYVPTGSALFSNPSLLVSEYSAGNVATYEVDINGNPILGSRKNFIVGLTGAEGAFIDPVTGDFLFSTFGGGDRVLVVQGFTAPPPSDVPDAGATAGLLLAGSNLLAAARCRKSEA